MSDLKLLPCPFCGSAAEMNYHKSTESYYVACSECTAHTCDHGAEQHEAAATWNTRSQPEATAPVQDLSAAILAPVEVPKTHTEHEDCNCESVGYAKGWNTAALAVRLHASSANALSAGNSLTPDQIDDLVFGYAPSCPIGEGRALVAAILQSQKAGTCES